MCALSLRGVWLFETLWTAGHQAPLSFGFPSQEYWSGLPFPSPIISVRAFKFPADFRAWSPHKTLFNLLNDNTSKSINMYSSYRGLMLRNNEIKYIVKQNPLDFSIHVHLLPDICKLF